MGQDRFNLYDLINDNCYEKIFIQGITSPELVASVSCTKDFVNIPFTSSTKIHKVHIGLAASISSILSIILIAYFFQKLKSINQEYLGIMDDNLIKMSKFTVQINNLRLDKSTQDFRMLKLKIWLHFDDYFRILAKKFENCNNEDCLEIFEVADVQISDT